MKQNKHASPPMNVGISLLLVVFLILCLFTFAAIALTSAQNESNNATDMAGRVSDYYAAYSDAEEELDMLKKDLLNGEDTLDGPRHFTFVINDTQNLEVTVEPPEAHPNVDSGDGTPYVITRFCTVSTGNWQADETVDVFSPIIPTK